MTPEQTAIIAAQTLQGATTRHISGLLGCDHSTVARTQHKIRSYIQSEIDKIISSGLTIARKATTRAAAEVLVQYKAKQAGKGYDKDLINSGLTASKTILQAAGLIGQPSTVINNLIQINQTNQMPETIGKVLQQIARNDLGNTSLLAQGRQNQGVIDV